MKKVISRLQNKLVNKSWFYLYLLVKKTAAVIDIFCKVYKFVCKILKIISVKLLKMLNVLILNTIYLFFKIKLHLYDNIFCVIVSFIWKEIWIFKWYYYNVMNHYRWNVILPFIWYDLPPLIYWLIADKYYYKIRVFLWFLRRNIRKFVKKEILYVLKYQNFFAKERKDIIKVCFYIFLSVFIIIFFTKFVFIYLFNVQFFLFFKRLISFFISNVKYFILYLKFKWYFFFLKHSNKFNLNVKRKFKKKRVFSKNEYFNDRYDFDINFFYVIFKSIMKTRNIFMYYKFRKDLIWKSYSERRKFHYNNKMYNKILYRLIRKAKLLYRKQRYIIWIYDLWIISVNFNFFYFYKAFFFFAAIAYSNFIYILGAYSELYLKFIIYLAV